MSDKKRRAPGFDFQMTTEEMSLCAMALGIAAECFKDGRIRLIDPQQTREAEQKCQGLRAKLCTALGSPNPRQRIDVD